MRSPHHTLSVDSYQEFLTTKRLSVPDAGFAIATVDVNPLLFPFQRDIVRWAVARGRAAIWADCGLGKSAMQLEWARHVCEHTGGHVLILAPLAVCEQTQREGVKFGIAVTVCETQSDIVPGINITNYEKLHHFDPVAFDGIVLDESSILKAYDGKTRTHIIQSFQETPYRLACTATPAPNDYMELGNHAEFLGVMTRTEMLAMFFTHDGGETQKWRLKGHAESEYWKWLCSWAVMLRTPADLGYEADAFVLPPLAIENHTVDTDVPADGTLFAMEAQTLTERRIARRASIGDRVQVAAELANASTEPWLIWCDLNDEADSVERLVPDAVQIAGRHDDAFKRDAMLRFVNGEIRVLVSKVSICGFGMNFQHCRNVAFVGLSDSYEGFYQAVRRCWRFGQTAQVNCHIITSTLEGAVVANIQRKEQDAQHMAGEMVEHMHTINAANIRATTRDESAYVRDSAYGRDWTAHLGDCCEVVREMESESIDYSIFSPPFSSLYTYSNSDRDMGNARNHSEFFAHFTFLLGELYRVLKSGRLVSFHCMNLPTSKERDGYIGITDFRGKLIQMFADAGFIYHSEVCIWKDPVTAMQRTKALGLLYKQLKKDSAMSRQGIPDYLVTMRKPGTNPDPVTKDPAVFPVDLWQRYASPVWFDINPSNTLQRESAREDKDERHIAPLQLEVVERAIELWTNPNDLVLTPFMGIGTEAYVAVKMGRRGVGVELKPSYFQQAVANLKAAEHQKDQPTIFDLIDDNALIEA